MYILILGCHLPEVFTSTTKTKVYQEKQECLEGQVELLTMLLKNHLNEEQLIFTLHKINESIISNSYIGFHFMGKKKKDRVNYKDHSNGLMIEFEHGVTITSKQNRIIIMSIKSTIFYFELIILET